MFIPNTKFLCSNLWIGELCTDKDDNDTNTDDDDDERRTKHDGMDYFGIVTNEPAVDIWSKHLAKTLSS